MSTLAIERRYSSFADVLARVGDVPPERIRLHPPPGTATELDVLDPSVTGGRACELVDGILVEKPMGFREDYISAWIIYLLQAFVVPINLGAVAGSQGPVRFKIKLVRMPDVTFIRWDSLDNPEAIEDPESAFLEVAPDLVVEVLSEGNTKKEMAIKLAEYAEGGVRLVWYVDPERKEVTVYPKGKERGRKVVGMDGVLDGGTVLPGFTLPVAKIFERRAPKTKPKRGRRS